MVSRRRSRHRAPSLHPAHGPRTPSPLSCPRARAFESDPQGRQLSSSALNGHDDPDTFEQEAASAGRLRRAFCSSGLPATAWILKAPFSGGPLAAQPREGAPPRLKAIESYPRNISLSLPSPSRIPRPAPLYPLANLSRAARALFRLRLVLYRLCGTVGDRLTVQDRLRHVFSAIFESLTVR